jgi:hypothetical protein
MKNICVYTCITGDYDNLKELKFKEDGIDYLCFTNNRKIKSNTWKVIYFEDFTLDNHRLSRKIKILGHPIINDNYDISVWVDGSIVIEKSIKEFIKQFCSIDNYVFAGFKHHNRDCIYDEAKECLRLKKDDVKIMNKQMKKYRDEHYPEHNGLMEMTVFVKKNNDKKVKETMNLWFDILCNYSKRDQLSFCYAAYKTGLKYKQIEMNIFDNEWFTWIKHNKFTINGMCNVYYDFGNGYNQNDSEVISLSLEGNEYKCKIVFPSDAKSIRINPLEPIGTIFDIVGMKNVNIEDMSFVNFEEFNNQNIILKDNPQVIINRPYKKKETITLNILVKKVDFEDLIQFSQNLLDLNEKLVNRNNELLSQNKNLIKKIDIIYNSKILKPARYFYRKLKHLQKK